MKSNTLLFLGAIAVGAALLSKQKQKSTQETPLSNGNVGSGGDWNQSLIPVGYTTPQGNVVQEDIRNPQNGVDYINKYILTTIPSRTVQATPEHFSVPVVAGMSEAEVRAQVVAQAGSQSLRNTEAQLASYVRNTYQNPSTPSVYNQYYGH